MSSFDKMVAQWVENSKVSSDKKEKMLKNISSGLNNYRRMENPAAADAKEEEEKKKQKEEEEKQQQEEAAKEEKQKNLPPLPPSQQQQKKSAPAKAGGKKSTAGKKSSKSSAAKPAAAASPAPAAETAPKKTTKRSEGRRHSSALKHVDFSFEEDVNKKIEQLHHDPEAAKGADDQKKEKPAADAEKEEKEEDTQPTQETHEEEEAEKKEEDTTQRQGPPPPLTDVKDSDSDSEAAEEEAQTGGVDQARLNAFTFGTQRDSDEDSDDDSNEAAAAPQRDKADSTAAPAGGETYVEDEDDQARRAQQMKRPSRFGIFDTAVNVNEAMQASFPETPKSGDKVKLITRALNSHFLFSYLDDSDIARIASIMDLETFKAGEEVLAKGQNNDTLFVVLSGEATATVADADGAEQQLARTKGTTFGDIGLMYQCPNDVAITTVTDVECATLERHTYKMIVSKAMTERRQRYKKFLRSVPYFSSLSRAELGRLAESLKQDSYVQGQTIIARGQTNNWLHFVLEGTVKVIGGESGEENLVTLKEGDFCGHLEFLNHHKSVADVIADSATVRTAKLSRRQFDTLVSDEARAQLLQNVAEDQVYAAYRQRMQSEVPPERDTAPAFDEPPSYLANTLREQESIHKESQSNDHDDTSSSTSSPSSAHDDAASHHSRPSSPDPPVDELEATHGAEEL